MLLAALTLVVAVLGLPGFPEGKVGAVLLLVGVGGLGFAGEGGAKAQLALLEVGELAVFLEGGDAEIDRAVGGAVGVALAQEHLDHVDLLPDVAGGGGLDVGPQALEGVAVGVKLVGPLPGDLG